MSNKYEHSVVRSWYETMLRIRDFENVLDDYNKAGKLYGTTHLYNGQESVATGICSQLSDNDLTNRLSFDDKSKKAILPKNKLKYTVNKRSCFLLTSFLTLKFV